MSSWAAFWFVLYVLVEAMKAWCRRWRECSWPTPWYLSSSTKIWVYLKHEDRCFCIRDSWVAQPFPTMARLPFASGAICKRAPRSALMWSNDRWMLAELLIWYTSSEVKNWITYVYCPVSAICWYNSLLAHLERKSASKGRIVPMFPNLNSPLNIVVGRWPKNVSQSETSRLLNCMIVNIVDYLPIKGSTSSLLNILAVLVIQRHISSCK